MCDSMTLLCRIDRDISASERQACRFPTAPLDDDEIHASGDFRIVHATSPLTNAGYSIEPVGALIPGKHGKRLKCGTVVGYLVEVNIPACVIGHNRVLVNGVPFAAKAAMGLLKYWLARNGCTAKGLDYIRLENAIIKELTPTYFEEFNSEKEARDALLEYFLQAEAVQNYRACRDASSRFNPAFRYPLASDDADLNQTFTAYIKLREFMITAYVKEKNQPKSTLLPIEDDAVEDMVQDFHVRALRMEPKVYAKWLKEKGYHKVAAWVDNPEAYEEIFNLIRTALRLDDGLRSTRLKLSTLDGDSLKLSDSDKDYLRYHLGGKSVRAHADFRALPKSKFSSRYHDLCKRIFKATEGIDLNIPYAVQSRNISSKLPTLLAHHGEFTPGDQLAPYISSRVSAPVALAQLESAITGALKLGDKYVPKIPKYTVYRGPDRSE